MPDTATAAESGDTAGHSAGKEEKAVRTVIKEKEKVKERKGLKEEDGIQDPIQAVGNKFRTEERMEEKEREETKTAQATGAASTTSTAMRVATKRQHGEHMEDASFVYMRMKRRSCTTSRMT